MTANVVYVKLVSKELNHFRAIAALLLTLSTYMTFQNRQSTIRNANKLVLFCVFKIQLTQFGGTFTKLFSLPTN